jgi:hypothetical protein
MNLLLPYLISFFLGFLLIRIVLPSPNVLSRSLQAVLALSLGIAASAIITFFSFLIMHQWYPPTIMSLHVIIIVILIGVIVKRDKKILNLSSLRNIFSLSTLTSSWTTIVFWILNILLGIILFTMAKGQPFGQWDAWALWNMKLKFLVYGGEQWQDIFKLHWHTQPDYPLLLPFINAWEYSAASSVPLTTVTMMTAVVYTVLTATILFFALKELIPITIAAVAFTLLFLIVIIFSSGQPNMQILFWRIIYCGVLFCSISL